MPPSGGAGLIEVERAVQSAHGQDDAIQGVQQPRPG